MLQVTALAAPVLVALAVILTGTATAVSASSPGPVLARAKGSTYFLSNPAMPWGAHNPLVIRPSGFVLFQDGQWVLEKLHWTGWGSKAAHAQGLSSSSNDIPNAAEGKRIITWAKVTLSQPGTFQGHRIYRCFRLAVPKPASYPYSCLQRSGSYVGLMPPGSGTPVGVGAPTSGPRRLESFLSPDRKVWCISSAYSHSIICGTEPEPPTRSANIDADGVVSFCSVSSWNTQPAPTCLLGAFRTGPSQATALPSSTTEKRVK